MSPACCPMSRPYLMWRGHHQGTPSGHHMGIPGMAHLLLGGKLLLKFEDHKKHIEKGEIVSLANLT